MSLRVFPLILVFFSFIRHYSMQHYLLPSVLADKKYQVINPWSERVSPAAFWSGNLGPLYDKERKRQERDNKSGWGRGGGWKRMKGWAGDKGRSGEKRNNGGLTSRGDEILPCSHEEGYPRIILWRTSWRSPREFPNIISFCVKYNIHNFWD